MTADPSNVLPVAAARGELMFYMEHEGGCADRKRADLRGPCDCGYETALVAFERAVAAAALGPRLTRVEVIDDTGRAYANRGVEVVTAIQDEGRTLKVFVRKAGAEPAVVDEKEQGGG